MWSLTSSYQGQRRVERVPEAWREELEQAVLSTRAYMEAIKEVMAINAELLAQTRGQQQAKVRLGVKKRKKVRRSVKKRSTFPARRRS